MTHAFRVPARPESFDLRPSQSALVVVDMQNAYLSRGGYYDVFGVDISGAPELIKRVNAVITASRAVGMPVVFFQNGFSPGLHDAGGPDSPNWYKSNALRLMRERSELAGTLLIKGTWDYELADELKPDPQDLIVQKPRYSGFWGTNLDMMLRPRHPEIGLHRDRLQRVRRVLAAGRVLPRILPPARRGREPAGRAARGPRRRAVQRPDVLRVGDHDRRVRRRAPVGAGHVTMRVAIIGVGSIGSYLVDGIGRGLAGPVELAGIAGRPGAEARLAALAAGARCAWTTDALALLDHKPDIVIEAAGQAAARAYTVPLLEHGVDVMLMSVGALAEPAFLEQVAGAAARHGRRVYLPSGAIGGLDVLRAARIDTLSEVTLVTSKAPRALAGAPFFATHPIDLDAIRERTVIFDGPAREAVRLFPANVNVATALSLAGIGADRTRMQVVADPALDRNVHEVFARGSFGELRLRVENVPSPANPKTSFLACLSGLATLRRLTDPIQLG